MKALRILVTPEAFKLNELREESTPDFLDPGQEVQVSILRAIWIENSRFVLTIQPTVSRIRSRKVTLTQQKHKELKRTWRFTLRFLIVLAVDSLGLVPTIKKYTKYRRPGPFAPNTESDFDLDEFDFLVVTNSERSLLESDSPVIVCRCQIIVCRSSRH